MKRSDPLIREMDYITALKKWMLTPFHLVFCENSNYKIDKIRKVSEEYRAQKIEILQFDGQIFPREFGKGYGELLSTKYAIQHSRFIRHSDYIIKVNGRYFIKNIEKIASLLSKDKDIYVMVDLKRNLTIADSRVFAFKTSFFLDYLSKFQDLINDSKGFYFEHALARALLRAVSDGHKWIPLPTKPIIVGYSGTFDISYRVSKIRWLAGEIIHRVKNYLLERY
ncbi:hypothetical protein NLC35_00260 [Candidatus Aminicenantes bacterium AC-334-K16]|nr:hypothetical protein [Candidatus Aminicenantes bacterium AC-334-K16]